MITKEVLDELLTVGKLKELIKDVPDDYLVLSDGCDCIGAADNATADDSDHTLFISRHPQFTSGDYPGLQEREKCSKS